MTAAPTLRSVLTGLEDKFFAEHNGFLRQVQELQTQERDLPTKALERILHALLTHDPLLQSPKTIEVLKLEKEFLDAIGFSPAKLAAARDKRKG